MMVLLQLAGCRACDPINRSGDQITLGFFSEERFIASEELVSVLNVNLEQITGLRAADNTSQIRFYSTQADSLQPDYAGLIADQTITAQNSRFRLPLNLQRTVVRYVMDYNEAFSDRINDTITIEYESRVRVNEPNCDAFTQYIITSASSPRLRITVNQGEVQQIDTDEFALNLYVFLDF